MLVKNLKSNVSGQLIVFSVLVLLSWPKILLLPAPEGGSMMHADFPYLPVLFSTPWLMILILPVLLLLASYYSHVLRVNAMSKNPLFVAMIFFLLMSVYLQPEMFVPSLLLTFLWLFALYFLFKMYDRKEPFPQVYNAGLILGLLGILYPPLLWAVVVPFLVMIIYTVSKWREWCIAILGWTTPLCWYFIFQQVFAEGVPFVFFPSPNLNLLEHIDAWPLSLKIFSAAWLLLSLCAMGFIRHYRMDYEMAQRKKIMAMMGVFAFTLLLFLGVKADITLLGINFAMSAFFIAEAMLKLKIYALADGVLYALGLGLILMNWWG